MSMMLRYKNYLQQQDVALWTRTFRVELVRVRT